MLATVPMTLATFSAAPRLVAPVEFAVSQAPVLALRSLVCQPALQQFQDIKPPFFQDSVLGLATSFAVSPARVARLLL